MSQFDKKAAEWDNNHDHTDRATALASLLEKTINLANIKRAMEYGSGTGLLSFALKDKLPHIDMMDASVEMTKVAVEKVAAQGATNLHPIHCDIMEGELPKTQYDLIYILQTLHHIKRDDIFIQKASQLLTNNGLLVIIDLVKEDGSFHDDHFHAHNGFDKNDLDKKLLNAQLIPVHYSICHTIYKTLSNGSSKAYPLFMMVAQKKRS